MVIGNFRVIVNLFKLLIIRDVSSLIHGQQSGSSRVVSQVARGQLRIEGRSRADRRDGRACSSSC